MPMAVDASSAVRRLHGSIETVPGEPAPPALGDGSVDAEPTGLGVVTGTALGLSGTTATGFGVAEDAVSAEGEATEPEQAASASAAIGMSDRERFVRMWIGTSVATIDRPR